MHQEPRWGLPDTLPRDEGWNESPPPRRGACPDFVKVASAFFQLNIFN